MEARRGVGGGGVRFFVAMDSRVWREVSSVGDWGGGIETVDTTYLATTGGLSAVRVRTWWLFSENFAGIVVVDRSSS